MKEDGQEVVGLSKTGVDECCMALVSQGQVIREENLQYELIGDDEDREALFKVRAARYAVSPTGQEVRLDQVIGVKRQPLYYDPAQLDLDSRVPSKKYRGKTYRELLASAEGRDYLTWMAENFGESEIRDFVRRILAGEEVVSRRGRQLNPHWYEAGAMKAARNARFRLIPGNIRAQVIASAQQSGQARVVEAERPRCSHLASGARSRRGGAHRIREPGRPLCSHREAGRLLSATRGVARVLRRGASSGARVARDQGHAADHQGSDDWLKRQVETRRANRADESAA